VGRGEQKGQIVPGGELQKSRCGVLRLSSKGGEPSRKKKKKKKKNQGR